MKSILKGLLIASSIFALPALANWKLDTQFSNLQVVSIKKSAIAEVHQFQFSQGDIESDKAVLSLDLASVESMIPIRNERMKSMLFEISSFPVAEISSQVNGTYTDKAKVGTVTTAEFPVQLGLHGVTKTLNAKLHIVKVADNEILVTSAAPVIVSGADFNLNEGIEALRKIAGLPVIATAVPVTFSLKFVR